MARPCCAPSSVPLLPTWPDVPARVSVSSSYPSRHLSHSRVDASGGGIEGWAHHSARAPADGVGRSEAAGGVHSSLDAQKLLEWRLPTCRRRPNRLRAVSLLAVGCSLLEVRCSYRYL
jgi:hypothetical protein